MFMLFFRGGKTRFWKAIFTIGLYCSGLVLWGVFFNWGDIPYQYHDWSEVNMPRLATVQNALQNNELPLHAGDAAILRCGDGCDRFFSSIDVITSPQILLIRWMPIGAWVLLHIWLTYTAGYVGLVFLSKRFSSSPPLFVLLFYLTFFNGHIISHLSVGHLNWGGYFLIPWLILLVDRFIQGDDSWTWIFQVALLLFAILLQGSFHQFVWALIFLGFLSFVYIRRSFTLLKAMVFACLAGAFRLFPPALAFNGFDRDFYGGYPNLFSFYEAMTHWVTPAESMPFMHMGSNLGYWEFDQYVGKIGLYVLLLAGMAWLILQMRARKVDRVVLPIAALSLLAYDKVFLWFRQIPIPLLAGERVTARIFSFAFFFYAAYAIAALEKGIHMLGRWKTVALAAAAVASVYQAYIQIVRLLAWRVTEASRAFPFAFTALSEKTAANHSDPLYFLVLSVSALISLSTLFILWVLSRRQIHPAK